MENQRLNSNLRQMERKLMENRVAVNEMNQYNRSSYMVEIYGIPLTNGKKCLKIIN